MNTVPSSVMFVGCGVSSHCWRFWWSVCSWLVPWLSIFMRVPSGVMVRFIHALASSAMRYREAVCWLVPSFCARYSVLIFVVRLCAPISASLSSVKRSRQLSLLVNLCSCPLLVGVV